MRFALAMPAAQTRCWQPVECFRCCPAAPASTKGVAMSKHNYAVIAVLACALSAALAAAADHPRARPAPSTLSSTRECQQGNLRCVERVIDEMDRRARGLARRCDHDAIFAIAYLRTTETFLETALALGYGNLPSVVREDALFADYYLRAFDAYHSGAGQVPGAW